MSTDAEGNAPGRRAVDGSIYKVLVREEGAEVVAEDGSEAVGAGAAETAVSDGATPARLRERVFRRDGHRCRSCGSRRALHAHHVVWRSQGGATKLDNLITLCGICHGLVHQGFLDVDSVQSPLFRDGLGRVLGRRVLRGPRVAQCASPSRGEKPGEVAHCATESEPKLDGRGLADHLDWFEMRGGKLIAKARYREQLRELFGE